MTPNNKPAKCNFLLAAIFNMWHFLRVPSTGTLRVLYNSLALSSTDWSASKKSSRYLRYRSPTCEREADYPQRLCHFKMNSLEKRRSCSNLIFLYKTLHNLANVPELVSEIGLNVPHRTSYRSNFKTETFEMPYSGTKFGRSAPLYWCLSITT
ncbi:hypothetical protein PYW08_000584 [Mythimna loreyi]|uniref:Uncharacterized protein n=1 Tax=Mythimna loreyi TaxID=667449 RepID=A0ACC2RCV4_9NEOP|nr:hypothetical protein PYW08_000584 [Mythimna loreyi]